MRVNATKICTRKLNFNFFFQCFSLFVLQFSKHTYPHSCLHLIYVFVNVQYIFVGVRGFVVLFQPEKRQQNLYEICFTKQILGFIGTIYTFCVHTIRHTDRINKCEKVLKK